MSDILKEAKKSGWDIISNQRGNAIVRCKHAAASGDRPRNSYVWGQISRDRAIVDITDAEPETDVECRSIYKLFWKATGANDLYFGEINLGGDMDGIYASAGQGMKEAYTFMANVWDGFPIGMPDHESATKRIFDSIRDRPESEAA